jgi:hypothetical protein
MTIKITVPSFSADSSNGGNSFEVIKSEPKKSVLRSKIATLVSSIAFLISFFHF